MKLAQLFALAPSVIISGCLVVTPDPTPEELAAADFGPKPDQEVAEEFAKITIRSMLKDPESARFTTGELKKGWFRASGSTPNRFAWVLPVNVNAKNSYGGYTGDKYWPFYFRGSRAVGMGTPESYVGSAGIREYTSYVELDGADGSLDEPTAEDAAGESPDFGQQP